VGHIKCYLNTSSDIHRSNLVSNLDEVVGAKSKMCILLFLFWHNSPQWGRASSFTRFVDHTQRRTTVGRTPLDELSARRRDLYLTTRNTHNRQTYMSPVGFEPTIPAGEQPLGPATVGIGIFNLGSQVIKMVIFI
jgi:hypothetical protein